VPKPGMEPLSITVSITAVPHEGDWGFTRLEARNSLPLFESEADRDKLIDALCAGVRSIARSAFTREESEAIRDRVVATVRIWRDPALCREAVDAVLAADPDRAARLLCSTSETADG